MISKLGSAYMETTPPRDGEGDVVDFETLASSPEMQAIIQAKIDQEVSGLKNKNSELIEKDKKLKENLKQYEGLDIENLRSLQKQMEENEEMRLLAEGKTEEVLTRRTEALKKDYQQQLEVRDTKLEELTSLLKKRDEDFTELVVDGGIRQAYVEVDFEPTAMEDIVNLGRRTFIMDEKGETVPRDPSGNIIFGKDGQTPVTYKEWLEGLVESRPYLRRPSTGSGAPGAAGRKGKKVDTSNMSGAQLISQGLKEGLLG